MKRWILLLKDIKYTSVEETACKHLFFFYKLMLINSPSTKFYRSRKLSGKLNTKSGNATHYFPIYICKRQLPRLIYYTTYHRILNYWKNFSTTHGVNKSYKKNYFYVQCCSSCFCQLFFYLHIRMEKKVYFFLC